MNVSADNQHAGMSGAEEPRGVVGCNIGIVAECEGAIAGNIGKISAGDGGIASGYSVIPSSADCGAGVIRRVTITTVSYGIYSSCIVLISAADCGIITACGALISAAHCRTTVTRGAPSAATDCCIIAAGFVSFSATNCGIRAICDIIASSADCGSTAECGVIESATDCGNKIVCCVLVSPGNYSPKIAACGVFFSTADCAVFMVLTAFARRARHAEVDMGGVVIAVKGIALASYPPIIVCEEDIAGFGPVTAAGESRKSGAVADEGRGLDRADYLQLLGRRCRPDTDTFRCHGNEIAGLIPKTGVWSRIFRVARYGGLPNLLVGGACEIVRSNDRRRVFGVGIGKESIDARFGAIVNDNDCAFSKSGRGDAVEVSYAAAGETGDVWPT